MFVYHDRRFRDILVLLLGAVGFIAFFWGSGSFWLPAGADLSAGQEFYVDRSDSLIRTFGYEVPDLPVKHTLTGLGVPFDSLVQRFGMDRVRNEFMSGEGAIAPRLTNRIRRHKDNELRSKAMIQMDLSENGDMVQFETDPEIIHTQTPFNSRVIESAIRNGLSSPISQATMDTLVAGLVEYQHNREASTNYQSMREVFSRLAQQQGNSLLNSYLSEENIWQLVDYYLSQSFWKGVEFQRDSLSYTDENNYKVARSFLTARNEVLGIKPELQVDVLPGGSLIRLKVNYPEFGNGESTLKETLEKLFLFVSFLFAVWILVIFYLRLKARALDTGPALVVSFVAGFIASAYFALVQFGGIDVSLLVAEQGITTIFFVIGMVGAIAAVVFFLLTAVSDSITRQYWPVKLRTWDLVRQGMFNNKPVGWSLVRGVGLGGILLGTEILFLTILPGAHLESYASLITRNVMLAPLAQVMLSLMMSLLLTVPVFMILVNQIKARYKQNWIIPVISGLVFLLMSPAITGIVPFSFSMIVSMAIGIMIGVYYIHFDFLTLILAQFTFLNLITSRESWLIQGSPDLPVFLVAVLITVVILITGFLFLMRGNESDEIPTYVPEYLEEQAQHEKVKQELEIARTVQITFLPETTPQVKGFDISAICIPAQDTGGDYYDIIKLDDDQTAVAIGDVSGKGIKAAFYMTFTKGVIHSLCTMLRSPKELMSKANQHFHENAPRGTFISMIYGVLDQKKSTFTHVRAGHNPILIKRADGSLEWLKPNGVAVGMARNDGFDVATEELIVHLEPGDIMVLYTDGITEAQNEEDAFYEEGRLQKLVKRQRGLTALELRNLIIEDVRTFMGRATQYDDMTLVVLMCTKNG